MKRHEAEQYRRHLNVLIDTLDDEAALAVTDLFIPWATKTHYLAGDRKRHGDKLYRCEQEHTSQDDWTPDITPALWTEISVDEYPEWVQPTGAQDAYRLGAKVSHLGKHWTSDIDFNTYEPSVYGWSEAG